MISIGMLKICGDSVLKPLELIFKSCIETGKIWINLSQLIRVQTRGLMHWSTIMSPTYQSLDDGLETRGVFLDISKPFDKVWHEGLLFKLKQNGISSSLLNVITDFLYQRKQRVVLNVQHSSWANTEARIPQGSILGPLFFLIYINDLSDGLTSNPKLFAGDSLFLSLCLSLSFCLS